MRTGTGRLALRVTMNAFKREWKVLLFWVTLRSRRSRIGTLVIAVGIAMMLIAGVIVMVDTNFGRRASCEVTRVGYDQYVDGEWVERVDEVVYVGDCEGEELVTPR